MTSREDLERVAKRARELPLLQKASAIRLTSILEGHEALDPKTFDLGFEADWIVKAIFELHRHELDVPLVDRIAAAGAHFMGYTATHVDAWVAGWRGDISALRAIWPPAPNGFDTMDITEASLDGFARLGDRSEQLVDALVARVGAGPESAWTECLVQLGRVGIRAGERAARRVREGVRTQSKRTAETRERVLRRISSSDDQWQRCAICDFGKVVWEHSSGMQVTVHCESCFGIGFVPLTPA